MSLHHEFPNYSQGWYYVSDCLDLANKQIKKVYPTKHIVCWFADVLSLEPYMNQQDKLLLTNVWYSPDVYKNVFYEKFPDSYYGLYYSPITVKDIVPTKNFNCFINRLDPIRQSWLYQFIRQNLFDQGFISFNLNAEYPIQSGKYPVGATGLEIFDDQFAKNLDIFLPEHNFIRGQLPYRNFSADANLSDIIMESKFSIVLETFFYSNDAITFTEKIFRCLRLPRPWVLFAAKNAVQYLRNLGFDVLDDIVDHSYDRIDFDIDRQVAILDQVKILSKLEFTESVVNRCRGAVEHNQQVLLKFYNRFNDDVNTTIAKAVDRCLN